jgi:hypothetical protein
MRRNGIVSVLLGATLAAGAIGAGCGDDDEVESTPTKSEYIADSNALCRQTEAKAAEAFERISGGRPTPATAQRVLSEAIVPAVRENVSKREELAAPDGDEAEVEAMIAAGKEALSGFEEAAADRSQAVALMRGESEDPATEFDTLSREYGIEECSGGN